MNVLMKEGRNEERNGWMNVLMNEWTNKGMDELNE